MTFNRGKGFIFNQSVFPNRLREYLDLPLFHQACLLQERLPYIVKAPETENLVFLGTHITFVDFYMFTQFYGNLLEMTEEQSRSSNIKTSSTGINTSRICPDQITPNILSRIPIPSAPSLLRRKERRTHQLSE